MCIRHRLTILFFANLALHITKSFIAVYTSEEYSSLFLTEWITMCNNDLKFEQYFSVKTYFRHSCSPSHYSVIVCKQSFKTLVTNTKKHKVQSYAVWSFYVLTLAQYQCHIDYTQHSDDQNEQCCFWWCFYYTKALEKSHDLFFEFACCYCKPILFKNFW